MASIYAVAIERDREDYVVSVRDLPEVVTAGYTLDEALELAADAILVAVSGRIDDGVDLSEPSPLQTGEYPVALPPHMAAEAARYRARSTA